MSAEIVKAEFAHVMNAESGWFVTIRGSYKEVMGPEGMALAESSAKAAGWDPNGRATAGWPSEYNLRLDERTFSFYGEQLWKHHTADCWCRKW